MKSLLVDALRNANGTATPDPVDEPVAESPSQQEQTLPTDTDSEVGVLFDESVDHGAAIVVDERSRPNEDATMEQGVEPVLDARLDMTDEPLVQTEVTQQGFGEQVDVERIVEDPALELPMLAVTEIELEKEPSVLALDESGVSTEKIDALVPQVAKHDWLITLARWSPALCVVALTAAAGSLVVYQNMTAQDLSSDLGMSESAPLAQVEDAPVAPAWLLVAETNALERRGQSSILPEPVNVQAVPAGELENVAVEAAPRSIPPAAISQSPLDPYFDDVRRAYSLYLSGDIDASALAYREVLNGDGLHPQALAGLAAALQRQSMHAEALPLYEQLLSIDPNNAVAAASLVTSVMTTSNAESRMKSLLQQSPDNAAFHFALGLVMSRQERWPEAFDSFSSAKRLNPGNADYSYNAAVSAQRLGRPAIAEALYAEALLAADGRSMVDHELVQAQLDSLKPRRQGQRL